MALLGQVKDSNNVFGPMALICLLFLWIVHWNTQCMIILFTRLWYYAILRKIYNI